MTAQPLVLPKHPALSLILHLTHIEAFNRVAVILKLGDLQIKQYASQKTNPTYVRTSSPYSWA